MVYPNATHNRFQHSLGVAHLARTFADHLAKRQPNLGITPVDVNCVMLAGLCHDLGKSVNDKSRFLLLLDTGTLQYLW